jgi:UDP-2-acetamido-3-amino-2,3-dideoxy-glucuronate N-acetyltransferase
LKEYFAHETALIDEPVEIGAGSKIWHFSHVMSGVKMGKGCNLGQNVFVGSNVVLGNNVKVQNNVSLYEGITCEDDVFLGPSMVFTNIRNPRSGVVRKGMYVNTYLEQGVTVGANATIVCGIRLGKYAFIGAGAVVTKDVPAYALLVGNPARRLGWMSEYGHRLEFDENGLATCPESGQQYQLADGQVNRIS